METEQREEAEEASEETTVEASEELPRIELHDLRAERDPMGAGGKGRPKSGPGSGP